MRNKVLRHGSSARVIAVAMAVVWGSLAVAIPAQAASAQGLGVARLQGVKLQNCQKREQTIKKVMNRMVDRGQKLHDNYSNVSARAQAHYTSKNKSLSNYETLVADVNAKEATAQSAINLAKAEATAFSCQGNSPKSTIARFKGLVRAEAAALKAYKKSVKKLIVGVKKAKRVPGGGSVTPTPTPTPDPGEGNIDVGEPNGSGNTDGGTDGSTDPGNEGSDPGNTDGGEPTDGGGTDGTEPGTEEGV